MMSSHGSHSEVVLQLAEEFLERHRAGERPPLSQYVEKYPELAAEIREVFSAVAMMENVALGDESLAVDAAVEREENLCVQGLEKLGDFRIIREAGRGGMGIVYEAEQISLDRHVALKVLPQQMLSDPKQKVRFEREAKAAAKLHHTNIVPVFGVGEQDGILYYVMQFIQGQGLHEILDELKRIQPHKPSSSKQNVTSDGTVKNEPAESPPEPGSSRRTGVSAAAMAQSLVGGEFLTTFIAGDLESYQKDEDQKSPSDLPGTGEYSWDKSESPSANPQPMPDGSTATGHLSDTFTLSDSFVLPGQSEAGTTGNKKSQKLTYWDSVAHIGVQVAEALQYAHEQGILHRDIKPSNLLMDRHGTVWVTDFGLAKADDQQNITHTGDILGTLRYMAPEMFEGRSDARSEVYALGLTLYELLCFQPAFDAKDRRRLIKQVTTGIPDPLAKRNPEIPRDLVTIVHKAIEKEANNRYQSAGELASDLERFIADEPIQARRTSPLEHFARWSRQNRSLAAALCAVAGLVLFVAIGSTIAAGYFKTLADDNEALADEKTQLADEKSHLADEKSRLADEKELERLAAKEAEGKAIGAERAARRQYYASDSSNASYANRTANQFLRMNGYLDRWANQEDDLRDWEYYFLLGQVHLPDIEIDFKDLNQKGFSTKHCVDWSPDGRRIVTGTQVVEAFDVHLGNRLWRRSAWGRVDSIDWSSDGERIAYGTGVLKGGKITILESGDGQTLKKFQAHSDDIRRVMWSSDGSRLLSCGGTEVKIWDTKTWTSRREFNGHSSVVVDVAFSPDGKRVASCAENGDVKIWDADSGKLLQQWKHECQVDAWAWSPDASDMAFASRAEAEIAIWNVTGKKIVQRFQDKILGASGYNKEQLKLAMAWSPDGTRLAAIAGDTRFMWSLENGRLLDKAAQAPMRGLAWGENGQQVAAVGAMDTVLIWDADRTVRPRLIADAERFDWGETGNYFVTSQGRQITVWDAYRWSKITTLDGHPGKITALCLSHDEKRVAAADEDGNLSLWDWKTGEKIRQASIPGPALFDLTLSPDQKWLTGNQIDSSERRRSTMRMWSVEDWRETASYPAALEASQQWSDDSRFLLSSVSRESVNYRGSYSLWDAHQQSWLDTGVSWWLRPAVSWDRGAEKMALATQGSNILLQDFRQEQGRVHLENGRTIEAAHGRLIKRVDWNPAGRRLLSVGEEQLARVWDVETLQQVHEIEGALDARWGPFGIRMAVLTPEGVEIHDASIGAARGHWQQLAPLLERQQALGRITANDLRTLVDLHVHDQTWESAIAAVEQLQELDPNDARSVRSILDALGKYAKHLGEEGRSEEAGKYGMRAVDANVSLVGVDPRATQRLLDLVVPQVEWTVLQPIELRSKHGTTLTLQADGSILPSGANPASETYSVVAEMPAEGIRALRLEVLPHPSVRNGSTGRSTVGTFALSEITGTHAAGDPSEQSEPLVFTSATASVVPKDEQHDINGVIDGKAGETRHWNTAPYRNIRAIACFAVDPQVSLDKRGQLTIHLESRDAAWQYVNMGCFRLAVSADPDAYRSQEEYHELVRIASPLVQTEKVLRLIGHDARADEFLEQNLVAFGDWYYEKQDWEKVLEIYSRAISRGKTEPKFQSRRTEALQSLGRSAEVAADQRRAIERLSKLISQANDDATLLTSRAQAYEQLGRWVEAGADYVEAIKLDTGDISRIQAWAVLQSRSDGLDQALTRLEAVSAANPQDTSLTMTVAALQAWFGQDNEYATTADRALRFARGTTRPEIAERIAKACCLRPTQNERRLTDVLELARSGVENGRNSMILSSFQMALGMAEYRIGNFVAAEASLRTAEKGNENTAHLGPTAAFFRAMSLFRQGKQAEARKLFASKSAKMKPLPKDENNPFDNGAYTDDLITWLAYREAKALIGFPENNPPSSDDLRRQHARELADMFFSRQEWAQAIAAYSQAITLEKDDGSLFSKRGQAYDHLGRWAEADADWEQALKLLPGDIKVIQAWANSKAPSGRLAQSLPLLARLSAANPSDTLLTINVAALQAWFEQDKEFTATIVAALRFAEENTDHATAERTAKVCCLRPSDDKARFAAALKLARSALERIEKDSVWRTYYYMALGMAEYRNGNLQAAEKALLNANEARLVISGKARRLRIAGTCAFYRAMSQFHQGRKEEAQQLAMSTAANMRPLPQDENNPLADGASHDDVVTWLAYKEAKALIGFPETAPPSSAG